MSNHDADLLDLDPTDDDLFASVEDDGDDEPTATDDFDLDFDSNYEDDRYSQGSNGMPSWSLFAN